MSFPSFSSGSMASQPLAAAKREPTAERTITLSLSASAAVVRTLLAPKIKGRAAPFIFGGRRGIRAFGGAPRCTAHRAGAVCAPAFYFLLCPQTVNSDYVSCAMAAEPFCKQVFLAHVGRSRSRLFSSAQGKSPPRSRNFSQYEKLLSSKCAHSPQGWCA